MNRIETALQALQEKKEKAFITYITAGLPDYDKTKAIIKAQEAAGTDIIELGIPFSDPVADGPVIQAASYEAILGGANLEKTFTCMKEMRTDGVQIPIVFMMYYNTVLHYGVEKFVKECNACGVDGLIIPDLPLEEQEELQTQLQKEDGTILIQLVSPVSKDRVPKILKNARGFVYCVSSMGVTGQEATFHRQILEYLTAVKKEAKIPVMMATDTEPQIVITATCTVASNDENHAILLHLTQNISASSCQTAAVLRPMPSVRQLLFCRSVRRRPQIDLPVP